MITTTKRKVTGPVGVMPAGPVRFGASRDGSGGMILGLNPHVNTNGNNNHHDSKIIVVDGANIAFESPSNGGKPRLANILQVCTALEERGFEPIVIVDAALRHKIDDPEQLEALIEKKRILQAPAGTDADYFVLTTAEQQNARVVSNDTFKDRIDDFPWIKKRRVPVMFAAGEVQLYEL